MLEFNEKAAIVTGAASGIGRASARLYAREGAKVVVSDVDDHGGQETVRLIREAGGESIFIKADVANPVDCEALVRKTVDEYGRLDYACNNAGIGGEQNLTADYSVEGWQKVLAVNLSGVFYCMKYEIPEMLRAGGGAIVNMASILGQVGFAGAPAYVAAKHGLIGLTKNAALEYAALEENPEALNMLIALHPIGRLGNPEEVAELVIWLSSMRASFVTGAYYAVDGGYLAR
jgi:NAD(P)-dependent dehydrogenase (short-subunit alcohol dehydrogenase family)